MKHHSAKYNIRKYISVTKVIVLFLVLVCTYHEYATAQLKIYVDTDLEGASGVYKFAQTREKDSPLNLLACEYLMGSCCSHKWTL